LLTCPASIPLSTRSLTYLTNLICAHGRAIGSRWRKLPANRQALLILAHLRNGDTLVRLAVLEQLDSAREQYLLSPKVLRPGEPAAADCCPAGCQPGAIGCRNKPALFLLLQLTNLAIQVYDGKPLVISDQLGQDQVADEACVQVPKAVVIGAGRVY
jgi:hypothetical protein